MKKIKGLSENTGITLISLIVTIIVLLILAGVTIATLFGENGILTKALSAKEATEIGQEQEYVDLATTSAIQNSMITRGNSQFTQQELESELDKLTGGDDTDVTTEGSNYLVIFKDSKREYQVGVPGTVDWDKVLEEAKNDPSIEGIGTNGEPVDMSLWQYTIIDGGVGLYAGETRGNNCYYTENGYIGEYVNGKIIGCVPQYIRIDGEFQPVISMHSTFANNQEIIEAPEIPSTVKEVNNIFFKCENLKTATIPGTVEEIGKCAFNGCTNLKTIILGNGIKSITGGRNKEVFEGCESLESIILPETVESMNSSFENCKSLKTARILGNIEDLSFMFSGCESLIEVEIPSTVIDLSYAFEDCTNLTYISDIPNGVTNLSHAFSRCTSLQQIPEIPDSVTYLSYTFYGCTSLQQVSTIPDSVTDLNYTFYGCTSLQQAPEIPDSVTDLNSTFNGCTSLQEVPGIPNSVTDLSYTFRGCTSLQQAPEIPNGVTSLSSTFSGCTSLQQAPEIPNGVTSLSSTFSGCTSLQQAPEIPNSVTNLYSTFDGCTSLQQAPEIPDSITELGYTFADCTSLQQAPEIPNSVTSLYQTFRGCRSLQKIDLKNTNIKKIGDRTFAYCENLTEIILPGLLEEIGDYAFISTGITNIIIPKSVIKIGWTILSDCRNLETVYCEASSKPSGWSQYWDRESKRKYSLELWTVSKKVYKTYKK